ncbi:MAG: RES family NAD+ phosphorylase [Candidatus Nanopelagicales bacterium]
MCAGQFFRHAAVNRAAFTGSPGGRWGTDHFSVIYLGRPVQGVVAEAYRQLIDNNPGMTPAMVRPRILYTVSVNVDRILDLTIPQSLADVGLTMGDLTTDPHEYGKCQEVAAAAHQLGLKGVLAPAAHGLGETLALFAVRLSSGDRPLIEAEALWQHLPADPRRLTVVQEPADEDSRRFSS